MIQKLYTLAVAATLLFGTGAIAQNPQRGAAPQGGERQMPQQITAEQRAEQLTSQMGERLNLDAKQMKSIEKINLTFARSLQANTPGAGGGAAMGGRPGGGMRGGGGGAPMGGGGDMGGGGGGAGMGGMGGGIASPGGSFGNAPSQKTPADMQAARERAAQTRAKKLEKILTPEQFRNWQAMEQERVKEEQERMARFGAGGPGGQRGPQGGQQGGRPAGPPQR